MTDLEKRFLKNTDDTGRFIYQSLVTGRKYYVEPIGGHSDWGDINPATKKVEGDYGEKYKGSVSEKESMITPENGFVLIETLEPGVSPLSVIEERDMNKWLRSNFDDSTIRNLLAMAAPWMLIGMIVGLVALFTCPVLMAECFYLALFFITIDRYYEIKDEKNGNR